MVERKTKFVDLPVYEKTREKVSKKKGDKTYDEFINEIMNLNLTGDQT